MIIEERKLYVNKEWETFKPIISITKNCDYHKCKRQATSTIKCLNTKHNFCSVCLQGRKADAYIEKINAWMKQ